MAVTEVKKAATVEEAVANAGTTVLSRTGGRAADVQTVDEVTQWEEENHLTGEPLAGEYRAYAGPYTDEADPRNSWTAKQEIPPPEPGMRAKAKEQPKEPAKEPVRQHEKK